MKKSYWLTVVALLSLTLIWACAPLLPYPTGEGLSRIQAERPNLTLQDLEIGRRFYADHCANCHRLHIPSEKTAKDWKKTVARMQERAKIDDATSDSILAYLVAMNGKAKN